MTRCNHDHQPTVRLVGVWEQVRGRCGLRTVKRFVYLPVLRCTKCGDQTPNRPVNNL